MLMYCFGHNFDIRQNEQLRDRELSTFNNFNITVVKPSSFILSLCRLMMASIYLPLAVHYWFAFDTTTQRD